MEYRKSKKVKKMDKLRRRPIGKQSGESVKSVPRKERKATMGRICRKRNVLSLE